MKDIRTLQVGVFLILILLFIIGNAYAENVTLTSGNVTYAVLEGDGSTTKWMGVYGNVSGNLFLGDALNRSLFNWSTQNGRLVFASNVSSIDWYNITDANLSHMPGYLTSSDRDNYTETFNFTPEAITSSFFTGISSDYALTETANATTWKTYSLKDHTDLVWAALVNSSGTTFDNSTADYQIIIPEDGTGGDSDSTIYYLWVEMI